jgi:hypothetical protein
MPAWAAVAPPFWQACLARLAEARYAEHVWTDDLTMGEVVDTVAHALQG